VFIEEKKFEALWVSSKEESSTINPGRWYRECECANTDHIWERNNIHCWLNFFPFGVVFACFHITVSETKKHGMVPGQAQDSHASWTTYSYSAGSELFGILSTQVSES